MTDSQQPVAHHCPPALRKYVIVVAFLASAMGFIDGSIVAIALPKIRQALGADFTQAQWISNAYVLFLSAFILLGGGLGDRLGVKFRRIWKGFGDKVGQPLRLPCPRNRVNGAGNV